MVKTIKHCGFEPILKFSIFRTEVPPPYAPEPSVWGGGGGDKKKQRCPNFNLGILKTEGVCSVMGCENINVDNLNCSKKGKG